MTVVFPPKANLVLLKSQKKSMLNVIFLVIPAYQHVMVSEGLSGVFFHLVLSDTEIRQCGSIRTSLIRTMRLHVYSFPAGTHN